MKTRRRGMKLLSLILAVMMIAGMIPISAAAAPADGKIEIVLKAGTVSSDALHPTAGLTQNKVNGCVGTKADSVTGAQAMATKMDGLFTAATPVKDADIEVEAGATFYVAVKMDISKLQTISADAKGIRSATMYLDYDNDAFQLGGNNQRTAVLNPILNGSAVDGDMVDYEEGLDEYYGVFTITAQNPTSHLNSQTVADDKIYHFYNISTTQQYQMPLKHTAWDFIIPVQAKADAPAGVYNISWLREGLAVGGGAINYVTSENNTTFAGTTAISRDTQTDHTPLKVKITGPSIELKGTPKVLNKAGQKVTVTPSSITPKTTGWTICESGQTTGGIAATAAANGTDFDISFDGSTLDTTKKYVVVYTDGSTVLKTGEFGVTAALIGTAKITGTAKVGETLTAALDGGPAGATLKYQWTADGKSISGATAATYTLTAAEAGKVINVVIAADGYDGTAKATDTAKVADGAAPSIAAKTIATAEYGADITAQIKTAFGEANTSTFTFSEASGSILKVSGTGTNTTVKVGSGAISGGNNTVNVSIKRPGYAAASTTATLTAKTKKAVALDQTSGSAGHNVEFTLPGLKATDLVSGDTAPAITWTKGTETACTATLNGNKITATLSNVANPGTVALTAAITSDDYQLSSGAYTLNVTAAAMTNITLNTEATNAGFSVSPAAIVQGQSGKVTVTIPADTKIDSITVDGNAVTLDANNQFELSTTKDQSTAAVVITFHAAKTVTATITAKPYDGTTAIDKSDVSFNVAGVDFEKAEYEDANVGTNKAVTITGITWPDTVNEYTLAAVKGDITAVTPASAAAAATAVANTNPTTANVIEAIKAAVITFTNADGKTFTMTVGDLLADATTDTVLETAINDAIDGVEAFESTAAPVDNVKYDASQATVSATVNPGSKIAAENAGTDKTFTLVNVFNDEATPVEITSGFSVDPATGEITVDTTVVPDVYTLNITTAAKTLSDMKGDAAASITATITVVDCAKEYKLENLAENATGEIDLGNIVSMLDAAKSPNIAGLPATIELSLDVTKSNTPAPGPSTSFKPYMDGFEDGTLLPGRSVTRAQFAKMLVIATGKFDETKKYEKPNYPDVIEGKWYVPYIACAVENKIMDGKEDGKMYPNQTITRQEAAKMIYVALGTTDEIKTTDKVKDFDSVQNWAKMYVATLVEKNIIKGFEDGTFKPKNNITRAQAAVMINRLLGFDPTDEQKAEIAKLTIENQFKDVKPSTNWSYAHLMYAAGKLPDSYYAG